MIGSIASTARPSFQLIDSRSTLAPMIRKMEETSEAIACETNNLMASTSAVRLVNSVAGVIR
jgi:hypothetical protein